MRIVFAAMAILAPLAPAYAGSVAVPGPEAGVGLGALLAIGAAYSVMRYRSTRK